MSVESIVDEVVRVLSVVNRPAPRPDFLGNYVPNLGCVRRVDGLFMQWSGPNATGKQYDGGDSAHRAGLLSFCGSQADAATLPRYMLNSGVMVRHPTESPWNNPWNCTRDQLIGYLSGCWRTGQTELAKALYETHRERNPPFTCQSRENDAPGPDKAEGMGDLLGPHELMYFRVCCGDFVAAADLAGNVALYLSIANADDNPDKKGAENNQLMLMAAVCGQLDVFVAKNKNYRAVLEKYWGHDDATDRYMPCVAQSVIEVIEIELKRYPAENLLERLLPPHLLKALKDIDLEAALRNLQIANPLWWAEKSAKLSLAVLQDLVWYVNALRASGQIATAFQRELIGVLVLASRKMITEVSKFARKNLPAGDLVAPVLSLASSVLGILQGDNADEEGAAFREQVRRDLSAIIQNTNQILSKVDALSKSVAQLLPDFRDAVLAIVTDAFRNEVFDQLVAELPSASLTLADYRRDRNEDDRQLLVEAVPRIRVLMGRALAHGSSALPHCLQAFASLVEISTELDDADELEDTRQLYGAQVKELYYSKAGLWPQIVELNSARRKAAAAFSALYGAHVVGVRSFQRWKPVSQPSFEGVPVDLIAEGVVSHVWDPDDKFDAFEEVATFHGELGKLDTISFTDYASNALGVLSFAPTNPQEAEQLELHLSPFVAVGKPNLLKRTPGDEWTQPQRPGMDTGVAASIAGRDAHLSAMRDLSGDWSKSMLALRELEALSSALRAAFNF